ncbi:hypothetical protein Ddye_027677 [Dipteronia dyeriana]|uniref:Uncharacterized protein n=1 Tax=Dipteronia dyeriana TaxID=168575 RepID=A0AAD9TQ07_9ROSI|nr:hypothetical protein Ddye_027677 [Dipteronia dyeriana]
MIRSLNSNFIVGESLQLGFLNALLLLKQTMSGKMFPRSQPSFSRGTQLYLDREIQSPDRLIEYSHPPFGRGTPLKFDRGTRSPDQKHPGEDNGWFSWLMSKFGSEKRAKRSDVPKVHNEGRERVVLPLVYTGCFSDMFPGPPAGMYPSDGGMLVAWLSESSACMKQTMSGEMFPRSQPPFVPGTGLNLDREIQSSDRETQLHLDREIQSQVRLVTQFFLDWEIQSPDRSIKYSHPPFGRGTRLNFDRGTPSPDPEHPGEDNGWFSWLMSKFGSKKRAKRSDKGQMTNKGDMG